jgi:cellulose synthase/poly-beta-1,6-N-acetylglucosamine synthase-like glycosyltransferase
MHWLPAILILPYIFLLLKIYRSLLNINTFYVLTEPITFVSVIVACRNEEENLPFLLNSIGSQDYPGELFEVIIVDDNSNDRTGQIASDFIGKGNVVAIKNKGKGKKQAIRSGINASSGNLIITTDADCRMGTKWIRTIAAFYEKHKPDMIICPVHIKPGSGFFSRFQELEFLSLQGITAGTLFSGDATMCNGANLSFTREVYFNHADNLHFEIASGDDIFLLHSLKKVRESKISWLESPDALVTMVASPTLRSFVKQRRRWISKVKGYNDRFTILLGIVTFVTIILEVSILIAGFINPAFIKVFLTIFLLKSVPDFLILQNTSGRYMERKLINWFLPVQIVYPIYVLWVAFFSLISPREPQN